MTAEDAPLQRWPMLIAIAIFIAIGALIVWKEPPARILVPADGWKVDGAFVPLDAPLKDLRRSVRSDPQTRYWRSWSHERGSQPGVLRSMPFTASGPFAVPYNGFAGEPGVSAFVECMESGRRIYLATSRNNTQWSEVWIDRPQTFCKGAMRVMAISTSTKDYIALGTPYELSLLSSLKRSSLTGLWFLVLAWCAMAGCFLLSAQFALRQLLPIKPVMAGLIGLGGIGYAQFFAYWYQPWLGLLLSLGLVLIGTTATVRALAGRQTSAVGRIDLKPLTLAMGAWLVVAIGYFALATLVDSGAGPWELNGRFTPARWSTDNQLPGFVARLLVSGNHDDLSDFSVWSLGDRPPLAYGWHAALHDVFERVSYLNDGLMFFSTYQLAIGLVLNTAWVALVALVLPTLGMPRTRVLLVILILAICPLFIFNSLFTWPKLLSGTLTLAAVWILLGLENPNLKLRDDTAGLVASAALSALGLLTHGGSAFGILAILPLAVFYRGMPSLKGAAAAGMVALALLLPWSLWQATTHSNGNALLKFAFAGTFGFDERDISVMDTVVRSYRELGFDAWLAKKRDGLLTLLFGMRNTCGLAEMGQIHSFVDRWRASDFYNVIPSLNFLVLGFLALMLGFKRHVLDPTWRASHRLVFFGAAAVALNWAITWDCFINHHQSYQALIALHLGLVLALLTSGRWGVFALVLNVLYGAWVWIVEPLGHFPRFHWIPLAALLMIVLITLRALRTPPAESFN